MKDGKASTVLKACSSSISLVLLSILLLRVSLPLVYYPPWAQQTAAADGALLPCHRHFHAYLLTINLQLSSGNFSLYRDSSLSADADTHALQITHATKTFLLFVTATDSDHRGTCIRFAAAWLSYLCLAVAFLAGWVLRDPCSGKRREIERVRGDSRELVVWRRIAHVLDKALSKYEKVHTRGRDRRQGRCSLPADSHCSRDSNMAAEPSSCADVARLEARVRERSERVQALEAERHALLQQLQSREEQYRDQCSKYEYELLSSIERTKELSRRLNEANAVIAESNARVQMLVQAHQTENARLRDSNHRRWLRVQELHQELALMQSHMQEREADVQAKEALLSRCPHELSPSAALIKQLANDET
ncbi:unnamed protein product [Vitrella brassicaformis CCMP3155]|uniref:Uncharacterized protein n=1 Tax=Vitrella brassicaformis (strain CCMP3155) TaxID=1169540 RepID=A0A0G4H873_VITBC|nr:unnamed protein product [Vitrella brassicaformis CCMP3155]|eukprot:CEM40113.1 unnamed protein product [Vitrella brassicaformis CCMP3155]